MSCGLWVVGRGRGRRVVGRRRSSGWCGRSGGRRIGRGGDSRGRGLGSGGEEVHGRRGNRRVKIGHTRAAPASPVGDVHGAVALVPCGYAARRHDIPGSTACHPGTSPATRLAHGLLTLRVSARYCRICDTVPHRHWLWGFSPQLPSPVLNRTIARVGEMARKADEGLCGFGSPERRRCWRFVPPLCPRLRRTLSLQQSPCW